jgi:hypothetical protein
MAKEHTKDTCPPLRLQPGDVIEFGDRTALVMSTTYPAESVREPEASDYVEPDLVILKHWREDMWKRTSDCTRTLFDINVPIKMLNGIRAQVWDRGPYLSLDDRREAMHVTA